MRALGTSSNAGGNSGDPFLEVYPACIRDNGEWCCCPFWCCLSIAILLIVIMVPLSYAPCEYDQWCLKKNTIRNNVDTSKVYGNGNRYWGLSFRPLALPRVYQRQNLNLFIFSRTGLEYQINVVFFWRIQKDRLASLFKQFGLAYDDQVASRANSRIKNVAPQFNISQYILARPTITLQLHAELQAELNIIGIEAPAHLFFLTDIFLPEKIKDKNLDAAVQAQRNIAQSNRQQAEKVRQGTEGIRREIQANSSFIAASATAKVNQIVVEASASANKTVSEANGAGLQILLNTLNVTDANVKALYVQYFAILDQLTTTAGTA